jgi:hypothetical protein
MLPVLISSLLLSSSYRSDAIVNISRFYTKYTRHSLAPKLLLSIFKRPFYNISQFGLPSQRSRFWLYNYPQFHQNDYEEQFVEVVNLVLEQGYSVPEASKSLSIVANMVYCKKSNIEDQKPGQIKTD